MNRLLVTGASGQLGTYLLDSLAQTGREVIAWGRNGSLVPVDLADPNALSPQFHAARPDAVIHAAARASVADCFRDPAGAHFVNTRATEEIASLCAATGTRLLFVSTDLVFDGEAGPYRETDIPRPLSVYGQTKRAAEQTVLRCPGAVVARLSLLYGPSRNGKPAFFDAQRTALEQGQPITLFEDEWRTPLDLSTAANALVALVDSPETGIFHLGGPERMSRLEMGQRLARVLGLGESSIRPARRVDAPSGEPRPRDTSLDSTRFRSTFPDLAFPTFTQALQAML